MWAACLALHFFKALECTGLEALPTWALNLRSKCVPKKKCRYQQTHVAPRAAHPVLS